MPKFIIPLNDLEYQDLSMVGGKAARLRLLTLQGFSVPETIIVQAKAFDHFVMGNSQIHLAVERLKKAWKSDINPILGEIIDQIQQIEFTDEFQNILLNLLPAIHFPHFNNAIVRSSSVLKEMPTTGLPGLNQSVSNVSKFPDLLNAIKLIWSSHWSRKSYDFRADNCIPHEQTSMAVIIQRMCKTDYSGVFYTGFGINRKNVRINVGWGLPAGISNNKVPFDEILIKRTEDGESPQGYRVLEEKIVSKDSMLVYKGGDEKIVQAPPGMLSTAILKEKDLVILSDIANRIDGVFNRPMKITWGHDRDMVLLDASFDENHKPEENTIWMHTVLSALSGELPTPLSNAVIAELIHSELEWLSGNLLSKKDAGVLPKSTTVVLGRLYINLDIIASLFDKLHIQTDTTARYLEGFNIYMKDAEGRSVLDEFKGGVIDSLKVNQWIDRVIESAAGSSAKVESFINTFKGIEHGETNKKILGETFQRIREHLSLLVGQMPVISATILCYSILKKVRPSDNTRELYNSIPMAGPTFDTAFLDGLADLSRTVTDQRIKELLIKEQLDLGDLDSLKDSNFTHLMKDFIQQYDYMAQYPLELSQPRISEDPTILFKIIGHLLREDLKPYYSEAYAEGGKPDPLEAPPSEEKNLIKKIIPIGGWNAETVKNKQKQLILEGRKQRMLLFSLFGLLRKVVEALGQCFKKAQMLENARDIHMLVIDELISGANSSYEDFRNTVRQRRTSYNIWRDYYTPDVFSGSRLKISPVNFEPLLGAESSQGIPVYPGKVKGRICKIADIDDFSGIGPDCIPVVERLSLAMAPYFINLPGIIIEENGPYPMDLILVRRMKKPCVSGFPGLRRMLKNGDLVEIDGSRGTIEILKTDG